MYKQKDNGSREAVGEGKCKCLDLVGQVYFFRVNQI